MHKLIEIREPVKISRLNNIDCVGVYTVVSTQGDVLLSLLDRCPSIYVHELTGDPKEEVLFLVRVYLMEIHWCLTDGHDIWQCERKIDGNHLIKLDGGPTSLRVCNSGLITPEIHSGILSEVKAWCEDNK